MLFANGTDIGEASLEFIRKTNYAHLIEEGKELLEKHRNKIVLPVDVAVVKDGKRIDKDVTVKSDEECVVDIGCKTINEYKKIIDSSKTIFINGPMGIFEEEQSELGTKEIWQHMANSSSFTLLGGGDSITAAEKYHLTDRFSFVSTGGGALIQYVSQKPLPVITALKKSKEIFG